MMSSAKLRLPRRWFQAIDLDQDGFVDQEEVQAWVNDFFDARKRLWRSLASRFGLVAVLNTLITIAAVIVCGIAILAVFKVPSSAILVPLGSILLSLSFAYGQTVQDATYSLYLNFGVRPFEVGDWVSLDDGERMICREIHLMHSVFSHIPTSRLVYFPNAKIYNSRIQNWSRTRKLHLQIILAVDGWITPADMQYCRQEMEGFIKQQNGALAKTFVLQVNNTDQVIAGQVQLLVRCRMRHQVKYSETEKWRPINTALTLFVMQKLRDRNCHPKVIGNAWLDVRHDMNAYVRPKESNWVSPYERELEMKKSLGKDE